MDFKQMSKVVIDGPYTKTTLSQAFTHEIYRKKVFTFKQIFSKDVTPIDAELLEKLDAIDQKCQEYDVDNLIDTIPEDHKDFRAVHGLHRMRHEILLLATDDLRKNELGIMCELVKLIKRGEVLVYTLLNDWSYVCRLKYAIDDRTEPIRPESHTIRSVEESSSYNNQGHTDSDDDEVADMEAGRLLDLRRESLEVIDEAVTKHISEVSSEKIDEFLASLKAKLSDRTKSD